MDLGRVAGGRDREPDTRWRKVRPQHIEIARRGEKARKGVWEGNISREHGAKMGPASGDSLP